MATPLSRLARRLCIMAGLSSGSGFFGVMPYCIRGDGVFFILRFT